MWKKWNGMMSMCTKNKIKILLCLLILLPLASAINDPAEEKPTDTSISIEIENAVFEIKDLGEGMAEITIEVEGKTSGNVHHCGIAFVAYFQDGTNTFDGFIEGPIYSPSAEVPIEFIGTGANNSWETWKFYNKLKIEKEKIGINESQLPYVTSFKIWARAYSDEDGMFWNQTYFDLTATIKGKLEKLYEEKNTSSPSLPLPIIFILFIAVILIVLLIFWKNRQETEEFFKVGEYILYEKEVSTKGGKKKKMYFFSKKKRGDAKPCKKPEGYEVEINKRTGVPFLKKVK
ncbi:MAG: hypothetical protein DRN29_04920 [Thermoplasmata archaeon]|nr:MAG: hypothetical protein DRN29_04920 [Thermoplasmata archaeon]